MKPDNLITLDMAVEELAAHYPAAVSFLTEHGVRCVRCGEPLWCTVGELFEQDHVADPQSLLDALNAFLTQQEN